ncbi:hypothetical protein ACH5RR_041321 [Cinchona calisaya]|uniref:GAG-pre-integrase domain-containing protein n=1 Tax=Cinchona calisaya TaxID=153742 RepID=A0ABD2XZ56_9GENT
MGFPGILRIGGRVGGFLHRYSGEGVITTLDKVIGDPIMERRRVEAVYVMSAQEAYIDKTRKNETSDLWHARLGYMSYHKLKIMMKKSVLKGFP